MAGIFGKLFKDTAIYGVSSVLGRFLNWLLSFVYLQVMLPDYFGRMTNLYALISVLMVILTYGMETAFFRYANTEAEPRSVFSTALRSIGVTTSLFLILVAVFYGELVSYFNLEDFRPILTLFALIIATDVFAALPLAYLRYQNRPFRFMAVRMTFVAITIVLTLLAFYGLPYLAEAFPETCGTLYKTEYSLYYIMGINLFGNFCQLAILSPCLKDLKAKFDWAVWRKMINYALPILLLGLVACFSNQADKIIFPKLFEDATEGNRQLGIYSSGYKIAVAMVLFTQAFRYAYEPFVFAKSKDNEEEAKVTYALSMKYYVLVSLFIFLGVMAYLELVNIIIPDKYARGFDVVPWIMIGQLMLGIALNLSIWYKLRDMTYWGAILSIIACAISITIIYFCAVPYGFMSCAWAIVASSGTMMLLSYFIGQHYYKVDYPVGTILLYCFVLALCLIGINYSNSYFAEASIFLRLLANSLIFLTFTLFIIQREIGIKRFTKEAKKLRQGLMAKVSR